MRGALILPVLLLGACAGESAATFSGDLVKTRGQRCAEAREIVAELEAMGAHDMTQNRALMVVACAP